MKQRPLLTLFRLPPRGLLRFSIAELSLDLGWPVALSLSLALLMVGSARAQTGPGGALSFDGVNDQVRIPGFGTYAPTTEITIEFWQKVSAAAQQATFSTRPLEAGNRINAHVPYVNGNDIYWDFGACCGTGRLQYTVPSSILGTWQHFALVASQSGNYMRSWI